MFATGKMRTTGFFLNMNEFMRKYLGIVVSDHGLRKLVSKSLQEGIQVMLLIF